MKDKQKYLSLISSTLPVSFVARKQYLKDITESVDAYCNEHPEVDLEGLLLHFGTAEEIIESISAEQGGGELIVHQTKTKNRRRIILAVVSLLLLCVIGTLGLYGYYFVNTLFYTENVVINSTQEIDLSGELIQMSDYAGKDPFFDNNLKKINATKEITCCNKKGKQLFKVSVTADFGYPNTLVSASLSDILKQSPKVIIETFDKKYMVETKDIQNDNGNIHFMLLTQKGGRNEEKTFTFYIDKNGDIH